ncbi:MAG TPA: STAS domain-containing protein [Candidatus Angelobacter sp.]|nr:STAS domain-containing protein [Candidatus Angelobacter sp.]
MEYLEQLKQDLIKRKELIAQQITSHFSLLNNQVPDENINDLAIRFRVELIEILAESLTDLDKADSDISEWSMRVAETALEYGAPMEETLKTAKHYRSFIWDEIKTFTKENGLPYSILIETMSRLNPIFDQAVYMFSLVHLKNHREVLEKAQQSFLEISTPVVPVFEGVAVLPLIGELTEKRAKIIMDQILQKAIGFKLDHLFIDLSGVLTIDTMVAHEIIKIVSSLSLLGVKSILTGIRPEISRTIVNLGISLHTESRGTLKQAIQEFVMNQK